MKRRAISLLAILAMLCTMVVFAMPAIAGETETYPCYKDHAAQTAAGYDGKNWSITTAEDWKAIIATANSATGTTYFDGVTFHLTNDVDFSKTEWLAPMGEGKYFNGTINGHGYGFDNLKIYEGSSKVGDAAVDTESATGMFHRLGNCTFVDFGVNSGTILRAAGGTKNAATTFGGLKNGYKPTFTRVWSGVTLHQTAGGTVCALAAAVDEAYTEEITVNGFVYDGKKLSTSIVTKSDGTIQYRPGYSMVGYLSSARAIESSFNFTNVISDAVMYAYKSGNKYPVLNGSASLAADAVYAPVDEEATEFYGGIFGAYGNPQMTTSNFENFYGVSYPNMETFLGREVQVRTLDQRRVANSAVEAAWTINNNPSKTAEPVYFTFKNGKVRPVAEDTNKIVKVTLTGIKNEEYFFNANTVLDLEDDLKKNDQQTFVIPEGYASTISGDKLSLGKEDLVIEVATECTHADSTYTAGENAHRKVCNMGCGYDLVVPCSAQTYTVDPITEEQLAAGEKATHSGTCEFCGEQFTLECEVDYVPSAKTSEESYWDYSKCICGRENIEHHGTAIVRCGDANGDDAIDLLDAVRILKKSVRPETDVYERNADVDGDDIIQPKDAMLAIRVWLGNNAAINVAEATQGRYNENVFNSNNVVLNQRLKMNGEAYAAEGYLLTDPIAIKEGEKIAFGPVRLGATVMGYFFDEENKPLQLVNYENATTEFTFEDGMAMVSITAPAGAKSIQLQLNELEKDQFYARIEAAVTLMAYQKQMLEDTKTIVNPLKNMKLLTVGDSLCAAANDVYNNGLKGWAARIRDTFDANVINCSQGGSAFCTARLEESPNKPRQYILNQLLENNDLHKFDYILLEGGGNDASVNYTSIKKAEEVIKAPIGTYHPTSFDPADFDAETTMAGGLERLIYNAIKEHGDTAAMGFFVPYSMPNSESFAGAREHFETAIKICEKWGIQSLCLLDGFEFDTNDLTSDGVHATAEGYDIMQPHLNQFMTEVRPVPRAVRDAVLGN